MSAIVISDQVRAEIGEDNARALETGRVGINAAQCWVCGGPVQVAGAREGSVVLSILIESPASLTLWSHPGCSSSRVVPHEEFLASPVSRMQSPVPQEGAQLIIDGEVRHRTEPEP